MAGSSFAFVTLVTSDSYANGALVVASALRELHTTPPTSPEVEFKTVCIVTPETVDVAFIKKLRRAFDVVVGVEIIEENQAKGLQLLGRPDLHLVLTKLHVFRLTQFKKIIFLDADVLPVRPISHLFTLPHEFSAVPDVGWPDIFNSGVMVLTPGEDKFNEVMKIVKSRGSWDGGDQGVLNEWRGNDWNRLSFTYNTTPTAAYTYAPAYERFGSNISVIHFIGPSKPWTWAASRPPFAHPAPLPSSPPTTKQSYGYEQLVDRWFDVYDRSFRAPEPKVQQTAFHFEKYEPAWGNNAPPVTKGGGFSLEELKRMAIEGTTKVHPKAGEGQYQTLPMGGRLDLMRPRPPSPPPPPSITTFTSDLPPHLTTSSAPVLPEPRHTGGFVVDATHVASLESIGPTHDVLPKFDAPQPPLPHHEPPAAYPPVEASAVVSAPPTGTPAQFVAVWAPAAAPAPPAPITSPPPNPHSPPMLIWNPAVDPPPSIKPDNHSIETMGQTYINVWDLPQTRPHRPRREPDPTTPDHHHREPSPPRPVRPMDIFPIPAPPAIPEHLVREGTYSNVTYHEADYSKVTSVFPWEQKQRHVSTRAFPSSEAPPPNIPRVDPSAPVVTVEEPTPEKSSASIRNPRTYRELYNAPASVHPGMPGSVVYMNAWDNIPSIQRYANKLVKPIPEITAITPPTPSKRRKQTQEPSAPPPQIEEDHDGDDEDTTGGSSSEGEKPKSPSSSRRSSVPSRGSHKSSLTSVDHRKTRSRTGSVVSAGTKEYKSQGVQTIPKSRNDQSVQTEDIGIGVADLPLTNHLPVSAPSAFPASAIRSLEAGGYSPSGPLSPRMADSATASPPGAGERPIPALVGQIKKPTSPPARDPQSPVTPGSPFQHTRLRLSPTRATKEIAPSSPSMASTATLRDPSTLSGEGNRLSWLSTASGTSEATFTSPISTTASPESMQPPRVSAGRKWDPARGVDVFKRDSQVVLAKFLKMGQWGSGGEAGQA